MIGFQRSNILGTHDGIVGGAFLLGHLKKVSLRGEAVYGFRPAIYLDLCIGHRVEFATRSASDVERAKNMSRARVYSDVNVTRPREYWDYENLTVTWG